MANLVDIIKNIDIIVKLIRILLTKNSYYDKVLIINAGRFLKLNIELLGKGYI